MKRQYKRMTKEDEDFIVANDATMSISQMCEALGRAKGTVDKARRRLGLRKDFHTPWTDAEAAVVKANPTMGNSEIAALLEGRTANNVSSWRYHNGLRMERSCAKCGCEYFHKSSASKLCGECWVSGALPNSANPLVRFGYYRDGAKSRAIEFDLSEQEFFSFWGKSCTYCGADIEGIGLDRIDSKTGYKMSNVTPCCGRCNEMKMADTVDQWKAQMTRILSHMEKNNDC